MSVFLFQCDCVSISDVGWSRKKTLPLYRRCPLPPCSLAFQQSGWPRPATLKSSKAAATKNVASPSQCLFEQPWTVDLICVFFYVKSFTGKMLALEWTSVKIIMHWYETRLAVPAFGKSMMENCWGYSLKFNTKREQSMADYRNFWCFPSQPNNDWNKIWPHMRIHSISWYPF